MQVDGRTQVAVTCDPIDVLNLLKRDFLHMNLINDRAEMFERLICDRTKALFEYFKLPFDAEPPRPTGAVGSDHLHVHGSTFNGYSRRGAAVAHSKFCRGT
jgi:hypothetical protein